MPVFSRLAGTLVALLLIMQAAPCAPAADSTAAEGLPADAMSLLQVPGLLCAPPREGDVAAPNGVFLSEPDDRSVRVIRRAESCRAEGKWADALAAYQVLIDDGISADFPAGYGAGAEGVYIPINEYCRRRMLNLPGEAVRVYRTLHDAEAAKLYERAAAAKSPDLLADVALRYPISSVALPALKDAADAFLEQGRYGEALRTYRTILAWAALEGKDAGTRGHGDAGKEGGGQAAGAPAPGLQPSALGPQPRDSYRAAPSIPPSALNLLLVKAAACLKATGKQADAEALLKLIEASAAKTDNAEQVAKLAATVRGLQPRDSDRAAASPQPRDSDRADWGTFGGDNAHSRVPDKAMLPGRLRWHEPKIDAPEKEYQPREVGQAAQTPEMICQPAVTDGVLYHRTEGAVGARDLATGKQLWTYREMLLDRSGNPFPRTAFFTRSRGGSLFITADKDKVYANIFYVCYDANRQDSRFKLVALNAKAGKDRLAWERGGQDEKDEALKDLSFTSAPIACGGRLYVGAMELNSQEMYLLALDAASGKLLWKTFICVGRTMVRYDYRSGNGVGEMPAEKDGIIYYTPGFGTAAAADAASGEVIWKTVFEQMPENEQRDFFQVPYFRPNNPPIVCGDRLFILPSDSTSLYALKCGTGEMDWRYNVGRDAFLLGVKDDRVVISGARVAAISSDGRALLFSQTLNGKPMGRGLLAESFALCPTEEGIEVVHLETGRFVGVKRPHAPWKEWLTFQDSFKNVVQSGNLLIAGGKLIITGTERIEVFDEWVNPEEILAKLKETPNDPALHAKLAWHYLRQGKYAEAAAEYEIAYEAIKADGSNPKLAETLLGDLFTVYLELGDSQVTARDYAKALDYFRKALGRAPDDDGKLQASVKVAEVLVSAGNVAEAVDAFQKVIAEYPEDQFNPNGSLTVQGSTYAEARIADLLKQHGRKLYEAYDAKAGQILAAAGGPAAPEAARQILQKYPNSRHAAACLLALAEGYAKQEEYRIAGEYLALLVRRFPDAPEATPARDLLATCLKKQNLGGCDELFAQQNIFPPLEQKWAVRTDAAPNFALILDVPPVLKAMEDLFYVVLGKNVYCRRARDGSVVWKNGAGWLGVALVTPGFGMGAQRPNSGAEIQEVMPDTPAQAAGLERGDVILEFDGVKLSDSTGLIRTCGNTPAGSEVKVKILRKNREMLLPITLGERPAKHDPMERGYRAFFAGMASVDKKSIGPGELMLLSRDRFIQCIDPITGKPAKRFAVDPQPVDPFATKDATEKDGLTLVDRGKLATVTQGASENRFGMVVIQVQPPMPNAPQPQPQPKRSPDEAALWNIATGERIWKHEMRRKPISDPFVIGSMVMVVEADNTGQVYVGCYSSETGDEVKSLGPIRCQIRTSLLGIFELSASRVCIPIGQDIFCYEARTGEVGRQIWARHAGSGDITDLKVLPPAKPDAKELVLAAASGLSIEVIEAETGRAVWSLSPRDSHDGLANIAVNDGMVYVCSRAGRDGWLRAYAADSGKQAWELSMKELAYASDLIVTDSHVAAAFNQLDPGKSAQCSSKVVLLDKATGKMVQEIEFKDKAVFSLRIVNGMLLIVTQEGIYGFGPKGPKA